MRVAAAILRRRVAVALAGLAVGGLGVAASVPVFGADKAEAPAAPKYDVETIMKEAFKGDDALVKKITGGKPTKEEAAKFLEYCQALAANQATKGDAASWKQKTGALLAAAQQVNNGDKAGIAAVRNASNCKACHTVHRGK
jgi:hypothetical protein